MKTTSTIQSPLRLSVSRHHLFSGLAALGLLLTAAAPAALAQATRIFVASTGNDASDGGRGTPKRNFQAAHDAVAAGGEIVVLDTAGYGILTITKSLTITVPPGVNGFINATNNNNAITIDASPTTEVNLRGLNLIGTGVSGGYGIYAPAVGTLNVEGCTLRSLNEGIRTNCHAASHLLVRDTSVRDVSFGIFIQPNASNIATDAVVTNCTVENANSAAIIAGSFSSCTARIAVVGCVVTHSYAGLESFGAGASIYADACTVSTNATGVLCSNGGLAYSRGNNVVVNNTTDGNFSSTFNAK